MKKLLALLLLCAFSMCSSVSTAGILQSSNLDAATLNFSTSYTIYGAHNVSVPLGAAAGVLCWVNGTGATLAINVDNDLSTVTPSVNVQDIYIPGSPNPGSTGCVPGNVRLSRTLQVRSASGSTVSSGVLYLYITDKRG